MKFCIALELRSNYEILYCFGMELRTMKIAVELRTMVLL